MWLKAKAMTWAGSVGGVDVKVSKVSGWSKCPGWYKLMHSFHEGEPSQIIKMDNKCCFLCCSFNS